MSQDRPHPDDIEAARQAIRDGTNRLHAKAAFHKAPTLTDAQAAAIARARLDARSKP